MKNLAALYMDSYHEFRNVRTLTITSMFAAVSMILGYCTIIIGDYIKIGFATISNQFVYLMFGPVVGAFFGGALDIIKYLVKPAGAPYFPGFTISAAIGGIIYGTILYKHAISFRRILLAEILAGIICNVLLGTWWLSIMYGKGFVALLPIRAFKNLVMCPINASLFYSIAKLLEASGIFRLLRTTPGGKNVSAK